MLEHIGICMNLSMAHSIMIPNIPADSSIHLSIMSLLSCQTSEERSKALPLVFSLATFNKQDYTVQMQVVIKAVSSEHFHHWVSGQTVSTEWTKNQDSKKVSTIDLKQHVISDLIWSAIMRPHTGQAQMFCALLWWIEPLPNVLIFQWLHQDLTGEKLYSINLLFFSSWQVWNQICWLNATSSFLYILEHPKTVKCTNMWK